MGRQGVGRRGEARRPAGGHAAGDRAAGGSRAGEAREDHPRRGRADRVGEAVAGGRRDRAGAAGDHAALSADVDGDFGREELDDHFPAADRAAADDQAEELTSVARAKARAYVQARLGTSYELGPTSGRPTSS